MLLLFILSAINEQTNLDIDASNIFEKHLNSRVPSLYLKRQPAVAWKRVFIIGKRELSISKAHKSYLLTHYLLPREQVISLMYLRFCSQQVRCRFGYSLRHFNGK